MVISEVTQLYESMLLINNNINQYDKAISNFLLIRRKVSSDT